jgi:hypothetical protein
MVINGRSIKREKPGEEWPFAGYELLIILQKYLIISSFANINVKGGTPRKCGWSI